MYYDMEYIHGKMLFLLLRHLSILYLISTFTNSVWQLDGGEEDLFLLATIEESLLFFICFKTFNDDDDW